MLYMYKMLCAAPKCNFLFQFAGFQYSFAFDFLCDRIWLYNCRSETNKNQTETSLNLVFVFQSQTLPTQCLCTLEKY